MAPKVRIAVTVAIVLGLLFGGIGLTLGVVEWRQGQRAVRTEGEVVELRQQAASRPAPTQGGATLTITDSGGGGLQYLPVVTFVTPQGQRQSFVSKIATNPPAYRVGV